MSKKIFIFLIIFLTVFVFLIFDFREAKKVEAMITGPMSASMKTLASDHPETAYDDTGYFYVPVIRPEILEVVFLFDRAELEGDQSGPIFKVPDGAVNLIDVWFINLYYDRKEGDVGWEYMADVDADKDVDSMDVDIAFDNWGHVAGPGDYIDDLSGVTVLFDTGEELGLDSDGMVEIPSEATSFTVLKNSIPIGAYIKFYKAFAAPNVFWWAWSENAGWINFNKLDCDPDNDGKTEGGVDNPKFPNCPDGVTVPDYGVDVDSFTGIGNILGYAWSQSLGWLDFDPSGDPPPVYPSYTARLDNNTGEVSGWARFLSHDDSWDGWVKLADDPDPRAPKFEDGDTSQGSGGYISLELVPPEFPLEKDKPLVSQLDSGQNLKITSCDSRFCDVSNPQTGNPGVTAGDTGRTTSLALDKNGNPVVSYVETIPKEKAKFPEGEAKLWVVRCDNPKCTGAPSPPQEPDKDPTHGRIWMTSLELDFFSTGCEDLGCPMIVYSSINCTGCEEGTFFVHCNDPTCGTVETPKKFSDFPSSIDHGLDIEVDKNGNPVIALQGIFEDAKKIFRCHDPKCSTFSEYSLPSSVLSIGILGWLDAELDFVSDGCETLGCPVVFSKGLSDERSGFLRCRQPDCSENSGWKIGFEPIGHTIAYPSLELTSGGLPVMIYLDVTDGELMLIRCTDLDCNNFNEERVATGTDRFGWYADLELDSEDIPFIAYQTGQEKKEQLKFFICYNTGCTDTVVPHGVTYDSTTQEFSGWAWGSDVTGWISFNCNSKVDTDGDGIGDQPLKVCDGGVNANKLCNPGNPEAVTCPGANCVDACTISDYKVIVNSPAYVESGSATTSEAYCFSSPTGQVSLEWTYRDREGESQWGYHLQVATDPGFSNLLIDCQVPQAGVEDGEIGTSAIYIKMAPSNVCNDGGLLEDRKLEIPYTGVEENRYWRIKVRAESGSTYWSKDWEVGPTFKIPSHPYPYPDFTPSPQEPSVGEIVKFTDSSQCYIVPCANWSWTFEDGNPSTSDLQNPEVKFTSTGSKEVSLTVTDLDGFACTVTKTIDVTLPLPEWQEIPPF